MERIFKNETGVQSALYMNYLKFDCKKIQYALGDRIFSRHGN